MDAKREMNFDSENKINVYGMTYGSEISNKWMQNGKWILTVNVENTAKLYI